MGISVFSEFVSNVSAYPREQNTAKLANRAEPEQMAKSSGARRGGGWRVTRGGHRPGRTREQMALFLCSL